MFSPSKHRFGPKKSDSKNHFGSEKILIRKRIKVQIRFGFYKILVGKIFGSEKNFCPKKIVGLKKNLGPEKNLGPGKVLGPKKSCVQKKFWIQKILSPKKI